MVNRVKPLPLLALALLSACASASRDCDPTTGGLIGAIGCDAQGRYDERLAARQTQQASLMQRKAELVQEQTRLETEQSALAGDLRAKQAARDKAARELAAVRARLSGSEASNRALQAEAAKLEKELAASDTDLAQLKQAEAQRAARLAELEREQANLTKEYEAGSAP